MNMEKKKKLLLHICCGPCAVYVVEKLKSDYEVTGYFYNPNIQPKKEYEFREKELARVAHLKNWDVISEEHDMNNWFQRVKGYEKEPEKGRRCSICFYMRLEKAFMYAKTNGFDIVASTLSISPYKVTKQINAEGEKLAKIFDCEFLPANFKAQGGFDICRKMAHELEIKHQEYCGCVFSKVEKKLRALKPFSG
ncbi:MAG TPA: epoxyqueuosine reductase QueH [Candidatus Kapabacteria bacterium]|nr:epoxyqueuosine reductase QueH [Candidatus Kapabacteria bacterium]